MRRVLSKDLWMKCVGLRVIRLNRYKCGRPCIAKSDTADLGNNSTTPAGSVIKVCRFGKAVESQAGGKGDHHDDIWPPCQQFLRVMRLCCRIVQCQRYGDSASG